MMLELGIEKKRRAHRGSGACCSYLPIARALAQEGHSGEQEHEEQDEKSD